MNNDDYRLTITTASGATVTDTLENLFHTAYLRSTCGVCPLALWGRGEHYLIPRTVTARFSLPGG